MNNYSFPSKYQTTTGHKFLYTLGRGNVAFKCSLSSSTIITNTSPDHQTYLPFRARTKKMRVVLFAQRSQSNETEPKTNLTQSFDWSSIGSAIEHNRTGAFWCSMKFDYRTQSNSIDAIGSILFGRKTKWYTISVSIHQEPSKVFV